ncbi:unnamed protein product [Musa acuminata subsp. malaccensis]|uniref:(wild Malaysian banana) hypothetical protein n=1 Tax=Musa acuminata subsp. malaccensis TaxID=214687 RepID=A0A804KY59_MUSAM|nr:unnamed protein product [Musa acuminata subsp. malaccensis]
MVIAAGEDENGLVGATAGDLDAALFYLFNSLRFRYALSSANSFCSRFLLDYAYWKELGRYIRFKIDGLDATWFDVPICFLGGKTSLLRRENSLRG